ncbi:nucleotidyltransferase domain-containing protein [Aquabacter sp. P-9]|uniref:nucleotidyltransferase domain-containing protein n=1 Tax=Aquabacter sediminis TaxID=3029197 RepID=UPI00237EA458|nr:nucleotidyltransferase [Aquabacter sp. P-9]MDE1568251.1 nucleotidyltransferase [Aquabacter sp. P-9]
MASADEQVERFLRALVDELAIPESRYEQAETSYKSLGDWFHRPESAVRGFDPAVYVQGSFRLGTAIRPINDAEEYDVDSVCELKKLSKNDLTQFELKQLLGREIKAYHDAKGMTKPVREGRRCWILDYADGAQFHMDIVPALPNGAEQRLLLERAQFDARWADTAIAITDREVSTYLARTTDWPRSNPKGYGEWFKSRMAAVLARRKQMLVESLRRRGVTASIEKLPDYRVLTPLQAAVMLLKRHRDNMFSRDPDLKPISVIITTLAAHAYSEEDTIAGALFSILESMDRYIYHDGTKYVIPNPTDPFENFADKWEKEPRKAQAYFQWLDQAREDFGRAARATTIQGMNEAVSARMGTALSDRAARKIGGSGGGLLRTASVAPAVAVPTFGNAPRVPTTPKGFA